MPKKTTPLVRKFNNFKFEAKGQIGQLGKYERPLDFNVQSECFFQAIRQNNTSATSVGQNLNTSGNKHIQLLEYSTYKKLKQNQKSFPSCRFRNTKKLH